MREYTLSRETIMSDIREIEGEWAEDNKASRQTWVSRQIQRLEEQREGLLEQIQVAMVEYKKSQQDGVTKRGKGVPNATGQIMQTEVVNIIKHQCGDPSYLSEIRQCRALILAIEKEINLLKGLYPALKLDMTDSGINQNVIITFGPTLQPPLKPWVEAGNKVIDVEPAKALEAPKRELTGAAAVAEILQQELKQA